MNTDSKSAIHSWLRYHYGNATKCTGEDCSGKSQTVEWALRKGKEYEKNKDNFRMLCISCHRKYDWDEGKQSRFEVPVAQFADNGELIGKHTLLTKAGLALGILKTSISNCLAGRTKHAGGFIWKYV